MTKTVHSLAGTPPPHKMLVNLPRLVTAYYAEQPDASRALEQVAFGTSGHRGSSFLRSFNEWHVLATSQAICDYRKAQKIDGPLFLGLDTHALSIPASVSAIEVLAANGVELLISRNDEYTPTPAVSHAILMHNKNRSNRRADGIVITPSHNPPTDGGFKYNPPNGGPADTNITSWVQARANELLKDGCRDVKRIPYNRAFTASTTRQYDFLTEYVNDLKNVIDMDAIRNSKLHLGVDPLGGAGVNYWPAIAETYGIDLTVVNKEVDSTFRFMRVDWDGRIRMDPSSPYAMQGLVDLKDRFDVAFACDPDHDRHGIVTKSGGLMSANHYLAVMINYLFQNRPAWRADAAIGKTVVSSQMIDRVATDLGRNLYEVPVGFKWFVDGLLNGSLGFGGEESAGASFLCRDGSPWSTDKDGIIATLLSAEITAVTGKDPSTLYTGLTSRFGTPLYDRVEVVATHEQKKILSKLGPDQVKAAMLAGDPILSKQTSAPGNNSSIGGLKVSTKNGWFAARPSGTEDIYKIYVESFIDDKHLERIVEEAQSIVSDALKG